MEELNGEIYKIINNIVSIKDSTEVRNGVKFGDVIWDFTDQKNERKNSIPNSRMKFKWLEIEKKLGKTMTQDLKFLTYFIIIAPSIFGFGSSCKIQTWQPRIIKTCNVIEEILITEQLNKDFKEEINTFCLGDLKLKKFQDIVIHATRINDLKIILKAITNPYIQRYFLKPVNWTVADVANLNLSTLPKGNFKELASTPLDEQFYIEIIKQVTRDIVKFKSAMRMPIRTTLTKVIEQSIVAEALDYNFQAAFKCYVEILERDRLYSLKRGKRGSNSANLRRKFPIEFKISVADFNAYIKNIHSASIIAILLFTGVRYSELISLKKGCIQKRNDVYVMKGTVTKHRSESLPSDIDEWVAIPIVRDAIEILECIQTLTKNTYLVAPLRGVYLDQKDLPLSIQGLNKILNLYILNNSSANSKLEKFAKNMQLNKITTHRLRHSLAQQLVRGRLGLPYISYHFKHVNSAVVAYNQVSNVTLGYGGISKEVLHSATSLRSAKKELFEQIYSPNAVVAGGGNAQEFMKRKTEYFQGLMVNDEEVEDIIEDLQEQSLPFLDVGLGYCGGRKDIVLQDGTKQAPPCIGQLKCNPVDCGNAVIPKSKVPIWKKVHDDAVKKLNDESYAYLEVELKEIIGRAERVINHFR